jgi:hypothetical protein
MPKGLGFTGHRQRNTLGWPPDQRRVRGSTPLKKDKGSSLGATLFHINAARIDDFTFAGGLLPKPSGKTFPIDPIGLGKF